MKNTLQHTAKEQVLTELLKNLRILCPHKKDGWNPDDTTEYISAMDAPHRVYHSYRHINTMREQASTLPDGLVKKPFHFNAAILFHDAVCVPCSVINETESVGFATRFYRTQDVGVIEQLIMATRHTFPFPEYGDDRDVLCDLDLAIMGVSQVEFAQYRFEIGQEYSDFCSTEEFDEGTLRFFECLHAQALSKTIYRTPFFRRMYEVNALHNIETVLAGYHL